MDLWFDRDNQEKILLKYLPIGRSYKQAFVEGSNFNKIIKWVSFSFQWLVDRYNKTFKGLYVCESDYLEEKWKTDYNIPNEVFYLSPDENRTDVFVLKYLMKGNTKWHFQAIANIYDVDVIITTAEDYFKPSWLPNEIPHKLYSSADNNHNVMVISFLAPEHDSLPHQIPHKLGSGLKIDKIKKVYNIIKEAQCKILYLPVVSSIINTNSEDVLPSKIPHFLGVISTSTVIYDVVKKDDRINFCKGAKL